MGPHQQATSREATRRPRNGKIPNPGLDFALPSAQDRAPTRPGSDAQTALRSPNQAARPTRPRRALDRRRARDVGKPKARHERGRRKSSSSCPPAAQRRQHTLLQVEGRVGPALERSSELFGESCVEDG
ncbi:hypothetical protein CDD83_2831 [Cordyceps sp. RAO-2017]|nr:hypothetical protein CDD83_2831 [Cordyceps sp. RAO-2017]